MDLRTSLRTNTVLDKTNLQIPLCIIKFQVTNLLSITISPVGMVLNIIVLWFLGFQIRRNAFSAYILSLAVADFLFLCSHFIFSFLIVCAQYYFVLYIRQLLDTVTMFAYVFGLSVITIISIECCLSTMWPIWYRCQRPRHTSAVTCVLLWALSLLFPVLQMEKCSFLFNNFGHSWCGIINIISGAWLVVLFVVLCGFSLILLLRISCGSLQIPVTRLNVTIALRVLLLLFFGVPFGIFWIVDKWNEDNFFVRACGFSHYILYLYCINICANATIYFLVGSIRHGKFQRMTLKLILQRAIQDTPEEEGGERGPKGNPEELGTA
ncbi:mas-related G-protein coupled receptor member B3 [Mus pahari]|uniref:mas-related G-protein coupled receptor member B3 n=1 Tax=Mus pahari TaxID=10093 RepID=UPI000A30A41A|nr:mas-related G-protein coupled receptor member B3 [Mus pahari]